MLTIPFLTDLDSRPAVKGSRDFLGIQQIGTSDKRIQELHESDMLVAIPQLTEVYRRHGHTKTLTRKGRSCRAIALTPRRSIRA